jgi:gliding motility-associated-like protein
MSLCLAMVTSTKAQVIDELSLQTGEVMGCGADSTDFYAQSFFTDVWKVSRFGVWLRRATPNAFVRLSLAPDRAGAPALDSLVFESAYINPSDTGQLYVIDGLNEFVEKDRKYWIVVDGYLNPATSGYAAVGTSSTFTDSFQPLFTSEDGGATWQPLPGVPMSIFVEGDTCTFPFSISTADPSVCSDEVPVTLSAGPGFAHYAWSTGDTTTALQVSTSGDYYCTVVDTAGCVGRDTMRVSVFPYPDPLLPDTLQGCEGQSLIIVAASGFADYLWQDGSTAEFIATTDPGSYLLQVIDTNGCVGYDSTWVMLETSPALFIGNDTSFCTGENVTFSAPPGFLAYLWNTGSTDESVLIDYTIDLWVEVTTSLGCVFRSDTVSVLARPLPAVPTISQVDSLLFTPAVVGYGYQWTENGFPIPGADTTVYLPSGDITVSVIVTDAFGCSSESALYLYQWQTDTTGSRFSFIPSGFSPNGDGVNDQFFFPSANSAGGVRLSIVNRWGEVVFEADPYLNDWTGLGRGGEQLPSGNYYYSVEYHNGEASRQGVVLMNR